MTISRIVSLGVVSFLFATISTMVRAEEDDSFTNYDSIVAQLKTVAEEPIPVPVDDSSWEDVALHSGVGFTTSFINIKSPEGVQGRGMTKAIEAHCGVNLFSRRLRAEGVFRAFARESLSSDLTTDLNEFEIRSLYVPALRNKFKLRMGGGISARYMEVEAKTSGRWNTHKVSTPSSALIVGFERNITPAVTLGPDVAYRSALISQTFDKSSLDMTLRLNATF